MRSRVAGRLPRVTVCATLLVGASMAVVGASTVASARAVEAGRTGSWEPAQGVAAGKHFGEARVIVTSDGTEIAEWFVASRTRGCTDVVSSVRPAGAGEWTTPAVVGLAQHDPDVWLPHEGTAAALVYPACTTGIAVHRLVGTTWAPASVVDSADPHHLTASMNADASVLVVWDEDAGTSLTVRSTIGSAAGSWSALPDLTRHDSRDIPVHALLDNTGAATVVVSEEGPTGYAVADLRAGGWVTEEIDVSGVVFQQYAGITSEPGGLLAIVVAEGDAHAATTVLAYVRDPGQPTIGVPVTLSTTANQTAYLTARASALGDLVVEWGEGGGKDYSGVPTAQLRRADGTWDAAVRLQRQQAHDAPSISRNDDGSTTIKIAGASQTKHAVIYSCTATLECGPVRLPHELVRDLDKSYQAGPNGTIVASGKQVAVPRGPVVALRAATFTP